MSLTQAEENQVWQKAIVWHCTEKWFLVASKLELLHGQDSLEHLEGIDESRHHMTTKIWV